jgi:hypothetical protein
MEQKRHSLSSGDIICSFEFMKENILNCMFSAKGNDDINDISASMWRVLICKASICFSL